MAHSPQVGSFFCGSPSVLAWLARLEWLDVLLCGESNGMGEPVKVEIFGQTYAIRGDLDENYVHKLARFVDDKMHAIAAGGATVDTQKVAVLAALAIADELHSSQKDTGEREELLREQAERCLTLVERALKQTA